MNVLVFFVVAGFIGAVGGAIYWYAKHLGRGDVKAAFSDPQERKKIWIVSIALIVVAGIILGALFMAGVL